MEQVASVEGLREVLRGISVLKGQAPEFDLDNAPGNPVELFSTWFRYAVDVGVVEPHAMTLSTVAADGRPSARVLILKDVDATGWHFAINAGSRKGLELAANPVAALTFYWPQVVRQVRISGPVVADSPQVAAADFLARPIGSRQIALTGRQSQIFHADSELEDALEKARVELEASPDSVPTGWTSYAVQPDEVEFWQGDPARLHKRLRYERIDGGWGRNRLWP
ncbi:pyridoxine/pyridoxamine 5'-phosphate oxidase [Nocardia alba]|uniref:pyridoxine/pyridoxamine 5'-phosphate oxidase n=1 Tax=Nocardia alba TaxID=225051 RepID=UPI001FB4D7A2|nr:pyridoxal 5'-phosphate synthase [Nocardia alba]